MSTVLQYRHANNTQMANCQPLRGCLPRTGGKLDPLRVTVRVTELGITGYHASGWLEEHHHVVSELATDQVRAAFCSSTPHHHGHYHIDIIVQAVHVHYSKQSYGSK